jgi:hypothetical protein
MNEQYYPGLLSHQQFWSGRWRVCIYSRCVVVQNAKVAQISWSYMFLIRWELIKLDARPKMKSANHQNQEYVADVIIASRWRSASINSACIGQYMRLAVRSPSTITCKQESLLSASLQNSKNSLKFGVEGVQ